MRFDVALAHKLGAWNERRLPRDLYDLYFLAGPQRILPDEAALRARLARVESRRPELKRVKTMTTLDLADALEAEVAKIDEGWVKAALEDVLPPDELAGLYRRLRSPLAHLIAHLRELDDVPGPVVS